MVEEEDDVEVDKPAGTNPACDKSPGEDAGVHAGMDTFTIVGGAVNPGEANGDASVECVGEKTGDKIPEILPCPLCCGLCSEGGNQSWHENPLAGLQEFKSTSSIFRLNPRRLQKMHEALIDLRNSPGSWW